MYFSRSVFIKRFVLNSFFVPSLSPDLTDEGQNLSPVKIFRGDFYDAIKMNKIFKGFEEIRYIKNEIEIIRWAANFSGIRWSKASRRISPLTLTSPHSLVMPRASSPTATACG